MSPRAACRLETLGFEEVFDYELGKADWLGHGLPREGQTGDVPYAGELVDRDPPTCGLKDTVAEVRTRLENSGYGFCLVLSERIVLGRVRRSAIKDVDATATAESLMEAGPSTVRPNTPAAELERRLAERELKTAVVTTPGGRLLGVFKRDEAERQLAVADA
jgi:CBS domain-containing protein